VRSGVVHLRECALEGNSATGGAGAAPGEGKGGAVYLAPDVVWSATATTFSGSAASDDAGVPGDDDLFAMP
jgi:hypothetical protein